VVVPLRKLADALVGSAKPPSCTSTARTPGPTRPAIVAVCTSSGAGGAPFAGGGHCLLLGEPGGGLAALWRKAGHEVTALGRGGGDASGAGVVVVAVPGPAVSAALSTVPGLDSVAPVTALLSVDARCDG
jgi:hypothetical protein